MTGLLPVLIEVIEDEEELYQEQPTGARHISPIQFAFLVQVLLFAKEEASSFL